MSKLNWWRTSFALFLLWAATALALPAQTFTTLFSFDGSVGLEPWAGLVQGTNGDLFGTTALGGTGGDGVVFEVTTFGALNVLHNFRGHDGARPRAGLVQGSDGNFYGTTSSEGAANCPIDVSCGTIFKISPGGRMGTLYNFCSESNCVDGAAPVGVLVQASDGDFYGATAGGGASAAGTIFKITPDGALTTLYSFCAQSECADGEYPDAGLIQAVDGDFYGTTIAGGASASACYARGTYGCGTVFRITSGGELTTLYAFCQQTNCADGALPIASLVQATDGNFYGTTANGGASGLGTVFKITPGGTLTTLYSFCSQSGCTDGANPNAALIQASDGDLYGTTVDGGVDGWGAVYKITLSGTLTILHSFCLQSPCGYLPYAPLVQDTNGNFYGTTSQGGSLDSSGTVFGLSVGLAPFVETEPAGGKVGAAVKILGTNLTGATTVTFNATPAAFTVEASSVIKAAVPAGATTGTVQVVTPNGTLSSNVPFRVAP